MMNGTVEITQEEYKMLLEDHFVLSRAERSLKRKTKEKSKLMYLTEVADMLDMDMPELEESEEE